MRNFAAIVLGILSVAVCTPSWSLEGGNNYPGAMCQPTHNAQMDAGQTYITSRGHFVTEWPGTLEILCPVVWAPVSTSVTSASILVTLPQGEELDTRQGCELIVRQPGGVVTTYSYSKRTEQDDFVTWEFALAGPPPAGEESEDAPPPPAEPADFYAFFLCHLPNSSRILSYYIVEAAAAVAVDD